MAKALQALNTVYPAFTKSAYPGAAPVNFSGETTQAMNWMKSALPALQSMGNQQLAATQFGLRDVLYPSTNPALQDAIAAAITPLKNEYLDPGGVFSQIRGGAGAEAGQYGSTRQGVAEGIAAGRYGQAVGDTAAKLVSEAYSQGLDTFAKTLGLSPSVVQSSLLPGQILGAIGGAKEDLAQQIQNYKAASRIWELQKYADVLNQFAPIVWGAPTGTSSVSRAEGPQSSPLAGAVGGAITLGGSSIMQSVLPGPMGYIAGAILGGLFS